uniref:CCHC-type domain-containing protein n=1 Tax=Solanum tuberosum TaxID=4113 RepID=M1DNA9_SOLTU
MATTQGKWNHRNGNQMMRGNTQSQKYDNGEQKNGKPVQRFRSRKTKYNPNVTCTYCGKTGHVHDNCYRLIGYPDDFEFTKTRETQGTMKANAVTTEEKSEAFQNTQEDTAYNNYSQYMSKEQYTNLVQQVTKDVLKEHRTTPTTGFNGNAIAGTILRNSSSCLSVINSCTWIIDSGASEHMCFDPNSFLSLTPLPVPLTLTLPNSFRIIVTHTGSVSVLPNLTLKNVLYVPVFKHNLISVHRLSSQIKYDVLFTPSGCVLQDPLMKSIQAFGEVNEGLYLLKSSNIRSQFVSNANVVSIPQGNSSIPSSGSVPFSFSANVVPSVALWHVSNKQKKKLERRDVKKKAKKKQDFSDISEIPKKL